MACTVSLAVPASSFADSDTNQLPTIAEIDADLLSGYMDHLKEAGKSAATISRSLASMKLFFGYVLDKGYIPIDPTAELRAPKVIKKAPKVAGDSDVEKLLAAPDTSSFKGIRDKAMLELLISTGLRVSELISLGRSDIDLKKRFVKAAPGTQRERKIPLSRATVKYLSDYDKIARNQMLGENKEEEVFFVSCQGEKMTRQGFWKLLKKYGRDAGIETELNPHMLRHSFAVYALRNGTDIHEVQTILGHSDITSTNEYTGLL